MLKTIATALNDYNEKGIAVLTVSDDCEDPRVAAEYVKQVLSGLKCTFDSYYSDLEHSVFIEDTMFENDPTMTKTGMYQIIRDRLEEDVDMDELFEYNGCSIINPFFNETMLCRVDPITYYGRENIELAVKKIRGE